MRLRPVRGKAESRRARGIPLAGVLVVLVAGLAWTPSAEPPRLSLASFTSRAPRSVWDSVYTEEQSKRGEDLFVNACESCHGKELKGIDDAPPLAGSTFLGAWSGKTVGSLGEQIFSSMPSNDPGTLNRQQVADVLAFIIRYNAFPPGKAELPSDPQQLKEIRIEATKP